MSQMRRLTTCSDNLCI